MSKGKKHIGFLERFAEALNNFFKIHWFWYTIIIAIPTAWFSIIIPYFGTYLKLQNEEGITVLGGVLSLAIVCIIGTIVFVINWYSSKSEKGRLEQLQGEIGYLGTITENVDSICDEKYDQLRNTIVDVKINGMEIPRIVTKPSNQLKRIIAGMTRCLVKFMETPDIQYNYKDFQVSIAYNFPTENSCWEWVEGMNEKDLTLDDLLESNCNSTFKHLMQSKQPYYFNNKKEEAKREHRYFYNKQDELNEENEEPVGSIFCHNFKVQKGKDVYVDAYVSISTNKKRFSVDEPEVEKNTRDNMISLVRDSFGKRITIELCLLYLEYLWNQKESKNVAKS